MVVLQSKSIHDHRSHFAVMVIILVLEKQFFGTIGRSEPARLPAEKRLQNCVVDVSQGLFGVPKQLTPNFD